MIRPPVTGLGQAVLVAAMVGVPGDIEPMEIAIDEMSISGFTAVSPRKIDQGVMLCVTLPMYSRQYTTVVRSDR